MIKPEELRIANLLKTSSKSLNYAEIATVRKIEPEVIFFEELWAGEYPSGIDGIPLTPEWLEKAGFKYAEGFFADDYTKRPITLYNNPFKEGWTVENLFGQQITEDILVIQYVHQLQNLYYALTGKELEFSK
jgi:hypothetical protein